MDIIDNMENATIRIDTASQQGSAIDVVRMVLGCTASAAHTYYTRLLEEEAEKEVATECSNLSERCTKLRINQKGKLTTVADAKTLVLIVFLLPGKMARDFRRKSAAKVCRLLGGDSTLVAEIEQRRAQLQSTAGGRATQSFLLGGSPGGSPDKIEPCEGMPAGFRFLDTGDRQVVAKEVVELTLERERQALKRQRCSDLVSRYVSLRDIGVVLDDRTKIEIRDNVSLLTKRDLAIEGSGTQGTEICLTQDPRTPTHALGPEQRGHETGIVFVAAKIGVRVPPAMSGQIGKLMKSLYKKKYDLPADWNDLIKRQTLYQGRPKNCYYERDEDIIMEAIRTKLKISQQ